MAISGGHPNPSRTENILSMGEGFTPLEEMELEGHRVFLKIDYLFPTGSYKDRGATVLISKVNEMGIEKGGGGFLGKCRVCHCGLLCQGRNRMRDLCS